MAKKIKISAVRLSELVAIFGGLSPQEIAKLKSENQIKAVSQVQKLYDELSEFSEPFLDFAKKYNEPFEAIRKEYQEKIKLFVADAELTKEEREIKLNPFIEAANAKLKELSDERSRSMKLKEHEEEIIEVEIASDDRFALMKELFEKIALEKYLMKRALVEAWEAIERAEDI